ncbi:unnamed protein product [Discula destructiva]
MSQQPSLQPRPLCSPAPKPPPSSPSPSPPASLAAVPIPQSFTQRKRRILAALAVPDDEYTDLSPKGTVDAGIRALIGELNSVEGFVTTSSCAGRVSVFLEGRRATGQGAVVVPGSDGTGGELPGHYVADLGVDCEEEEEEKEEEKEEEEEEEEDGGGEDRMAQGQGEVDGSGIGNERNTVAGFGGKGGGGRWLFVSHEPLETHGKLDSEPNIVAALLGMEEPIFNGVEGCGAGEMSGVDTRLIHFKFEPMILHVLTASPHHAQLILRCGLQAGFRESGAINVLPPSSSTSAATPIVAIRSMGLGLESLIGTETNGIKHCTVSGDYLRALISIANERFVENARRIARFQSLLKAAVEKEAAGARKKDGWEDAEARRGRKRAEGLRRAEEVRKVKGELEGEQLWGEEELAMEALQ